MCVDVHSLEPKSIRVCNFDLRLSFEIIHTHTPARASAVTKSTESRSCALILWLPERDLLEEGREKMNNELGMTWRQAGETETSDTIQ